MIEDTFYRFPFHKQILYYYTLENLEWDCKLTFDTNAARRGHNINKIWFMIFFFFFFCECSDCFKKLPLIDLFILYLLTGEFLPEVVLLLLQPVDLFLLVLNAELQFGGLGPIKLNRRALGAAVNFARAHVKGPFHPRGVAEIKRER